MDLKHLRSFVVLAEELHFGRAASRLGISQPPLSQQIHLLEETTGGPLFARTSRRVELTEAGRLFLPEARAVLLRMDEAMLVGQRAVHGELGELKIGFTASAPLANIMPTLIHAFRQTRPDVHLTLLELLSSLQVQALRDGRLDVGFLRAPSDPAAQDDEVTAVALQSEELLVFLHAHHRLAALPPEARLVLAELKDDAFVHFSAEAGASTSGQFHALCREAGFEPRIIQEAREASTIIGLVEAGLGVTLLASSFRSISLPHVVTRRLAEPVPLLTTWLAHRTHDPSPVVAAFLALAARQGRLPR
ncbi:LysR substrate-binding domain-containing protein [Ancylobacter sp. 6x-1]|uniref:LysR substrate-binding domain-containing protein n=1 Tax=Ancylobacter crimeensis TaxID=2579147 RepID=A0ABT0D8H7_9HYPH|nr:LysR substrate-binding domain-containing protein [Ancylobacter crimeensis]MCK0196224.1 LysR substrate-binding domain-containing protein [Ancylobacter crimeensis]